MSRFLFSFAEVEKEIESLKGIAHRFLDSSALSVLTDLKSQLDGIKSDQNRNSNWSISLKRPLHTKPCGGAYQRGRRGKHDLFASISSTWEIRPSVSDPRRIFEIAGNASSLVRLLEKTEEGQVELGRFHVDIGQEGGPGSVFHVQLSPQHEPSVFPSTLDIPRFPMPPLTPLGVIEYVLGELFQEDWLREVSQGSTSQTLWTGIQRNRLVNYFDWQLQLLCGRRGEGSTSPLMELKNSGVESRLFLDRYSRRFADGC